jgi:catechol 2,3-dioxygenase-like lactoylglutathione lyase family enzyme
MKIQITSVPVDDQTKALAFYTEKLGFVPSKDIPLGENARWLTVVSPEGPPDVELLLEPMGHPAAAVYQKALYDDGIPWTAFNVDDLEAEYARLTGLGVSFRVPPTDMGTFKFAQIEDTCGNLLQIVEVRETTARG